MAHAFTTCPLRRFVAFAARTNASAYFKLYDFDDLPDPLVDINLRNGEKTLPMANGTYVQYNVISLISAYRSVSNETYFAAAVNFYKGGQGKNSILIHFIYLNNSDSAYRKYLQTYVGEVFPSELSNNTAAGFEIHFSSDSTVLYLSYSTPSFPHTVHLRANVSDILETKEVNFESLNRTSAFSPGQYDSTWIFGSKPSSSYFSLYAQQGGAPSNATSPLRLDFGNDEAGPLQSSMDLVDPVSEATSGNISLLKMYPDGLFISAMSSQNSAGQPMWVLNIIDIASPSPKRNTTHWAEDGGFINSADTFHGVTASGEKRLCLIFISTLDRSSKFSFKYGCTSSSSGESIDQRMTELFVNSTFNSYLNNWNGVLSPNANWYPRGCPPCSP